MELRHALTFALQALKACFMRTLVSHDRFFIYLTVVMNFILLTQVA